MSVVASTMPIGTRVWLAAGTTDMRKGFTGLSAVVQNTLASSPFCGHVFVFRGRRGHLLKLLWWDGTGLCLMAKWLERGRFIWPRNALYAALHLDARIICSPAAMQAEITLRPSTACSAPQNSAATIPKPFFAKCSRESPIIRSTVSTSCCPGSSSR